MVQKWLDGAEFILSICNDCNQEYKKMLPYKNGWNVCKPCQNARGRASNKKPERQKYLKNWHYKTRYGITNDDVEALKLKQNNRCAICNIETNRLVVDHDHKTGIIRELICDNCNLFLGRSQESIDILLSAIKYLNKHKVMVDANGHYKDRDIIE